MSDILTMLDVMKANSGDPEVSIIEDNIVFAPEFELLPSKSIETTHYKARIRTGLPTVGFRAANLGFPRSKSTYEERLINTFILSGRVEGDRAVVDTWPGGSDAYFAEEGAAVFQAGQRIFGTQFYYGKVAESDGFPGLEAAVADAMTLDATGTTADGATSIYFVRMGVRDVRGVNGNGGGMQLGSIHEETIEDKDGNSLPGYVADMTSWLGLQAVNENSIARIYNITKETGKTVDDDLLSRALELFPSQFQPTHIFMNKQSVGQLARSRTATNITGVPAPRPTDYEGLPIIATDSLIITEPIVA